MVDAVPFVKWAGGKTRLVPDILSSLPAWSRTYYEPFVGGGAVFFAMARERRFDRAVLGDACPDLVCLYAQVRDRVDDLVLVLGDYATRACDREFYYQVRALDSDDLDPVERAARFLFLNRTCFNGLYRVNRRGQFNVPFGRYANTRVLNEPVLRAASEVLRGVDLWCEDFEAVVAAAQAGDTAYFDPPYVPVSATADFTKYTAVDFGADDHERLSEVYASLVDRGVRAVLSNSDSPLARDLYAGSAYDVRRVRAPRAINSVASRRGAVSELLVSAKS